MTWIPFRRSRVEQRSLHPFLLDLDLYPSNASGVPVNPTSALGLSAVYASVRLLSETIATLPADVFLKTGKTRIEAPEEMRPAWLDDPGTGLWDGPIDLKSQILTSMLLWGTAYVLTPRDQGRVVGLVVLQPDEVTPPQRAGEPFKVKGQELSPFELMPIRGLTLPGYYVGCSPITYAREAIGLPLAAQRFGAAFFGNNAMPGSVVEVPGTLSEDGQKALVAYLEERHKGPGKAHKMGVLTEGAKLNKLTIPPNDAQFLETRQFSVSDIARMFGVPPHLIGDASGSTSWGSGLSEQDIAFVKRSLRPWVTRIDWAFTQLWHSEGGPEEGFIRVNMGAELRGSTRERYESYEIGLKAGFLTKDEVRALEDLPPLEEPLDQPTPTEEDAA